MSGPCDPQVEGEAARVYAEVGREELKFVATLERGEKQLEQVLRECKEGGIIAGKDVFALYDTFGFPVEMTEEVAMERGVGVDMEGFTREMEVQRKQSQVPNAALPARKREREREG